MRPQLGAILSVVRAAADKQRLLTLAELRAQLEAADRGACLVTAPERVAIVEAAGDSSSENYGNNFGAGQGNHES